MSTTSRELVLRAIDFRSPKRLPFDFPAEFGTNEDPVAVGHLPEAVDAMCREFLRIAISPGRPSR